jgi:hypothetical protein
MLLPFTGAANACDRMDAVSTAPFGVHHWVYTIW